MYKLYKPGSFEAVNHWYPKALNATIHPMVAFFLNLSKERIIERYCHLHPLVKREYLTTILTRRPKYFKWAGADLINVTSESGKRQMVVIENNSCPSGQKSMPLLDDHDDMGSYRKLIERTFIPSLKGARQVEEGKLAVLYDKNIMEASGYAATIAELMKEEVYLIHYPAEGHSHLRYNDEVLQLYTKAGEWINIRAAFRYVTQKPWNRIPLQCKTKILNPVLACLAGGRNKMVAAKAYDLYNAELQGSGLKINTPETIWDVSKNEIPLWIQRLGGHAVVKVPYSNAGQGVYTIVNRHELNEFMKLDFEYNQFIVQSLIGNYQWSSKGSKGKLYHVGTIPDSKGHTYVTDLRIMISSGLEGMQPLCVYARRSKDPLVDHIDSSSKSWDMLGTNLSFKNDDGSWNSDSNRLLLMDRRDFNKLGIGIDDLIEGYIQTVLSTIAIDNMCLQLINSKGKFRKQLFSALNDDEQLLGEIKF